MAVPIECFANDAAATTLSGNGGSITSGATSFTVANGTGLSNALITNGQLRLRIENEIIVVSSVSGNTVTVASSGRGAEGTTAAVHNDGVTAIPVLTAAALARWTTSYLTQPRHAGVLGWTGIPNHCADGTVAPAAGVAQYMRIYVPETITVSNILASLSIGGSGAQALANCFAGLYNSSGTRLGVSSDQSTPWATAAFKTIALTVDTGQSLTIIGGPDVFVWAAILIGTQATTTAKFAASRAVSSLCNAGQTANAPARFITNGSALTALPATVTLTAGSALQQEIWMGLS